MNTLELPSPSPSSRRRGRVQDGIDTRETLIITAERLIAHKGPHGVALREISVAAGQRNNSAVQYHFGTKTDLIHAIFRHRLPRINRRRLELVHAAGCRTVRDLVRAEITPYAELTAEPEVHYVEFVARLFMDAQFAIMFERLDEPELVQGQLEIRRRLARLMRGMPRGTIDQRLWLATTQIIYGLAERRRISETMGAAWTIPLETYVENYVDYAAGGLAAPVSDAARPLGDFRMGKIGQ